MNHLNPCLLKSLCTKGRNTQYATFKNMILPYLFCGISYCVMSCIFASKTSHQPQTILLSSSCVSPCFVFFFISFILDFHISRFSPLHFLGNKPLFSSLVCLSAHLPVEQPACAARPPAARRLPTTHASDLPLPPTVLIQCDGNYVEPP